MLMCYTKKVSQVFTGPTFWFSFDVRSKVSQKDGPVVGWNDKLNKTRHLNYFNNGFIVLVSYIFSVIVSTSH